MKQNTTKMTNNLKHEMNVKIKENLNEIESLKREISELKNIREQNADLQDKVLKGNETLNDRLDNTTAFSGL